MASSTVNDSGKPRPQWFLWALYSSLPLPKPVSHLWPPPNLCSGSPEEVSLQLVFPNHGNMPSFIFEEFMKSLQVDKIKCNI